MLLKAGKPAFAGFVTFAACISIAASMQSASGAETAAVAGNALHIDVATECAQGSTIFTVKNIGTSWPKTTTFAIYRLGSGKGQVVAKRRLRLTEGQQASFRITAKRNPTGQLGLAVQPGWYERPAGYDATAACR